MHPATVGFYQTPLSVYLFIVLLIIIIFYQKCKIYNLTFSQRARLHPRIRPIHSHIQWLDSCK